MSGPVQRPLTTKTSDGSTTVRPTTTLSFNAADFDISKTGSEATISLDSSGTGAALTRYMVGYGSASNLLTGSSLFTYDDTAGAEIVNIVSTGNTASLRLEGTDADANHGPIMEFFRNSASPADNDLIGKISFTANDAGGAKHEFGIIRAILRDSGAGSEDGAVLFEASQFGADATEFLRYGLNAGQSQREVVVNEGGSSAINFRVESDNISNLIVTSGTNNNVGIGTSPNTNTVLHISDDGTKANTVRIESTDNDTAVGPVLDLRRNNADGTATDGDNLGVIQFAGLQHPCRRGT
jgi:hypothetical protein